MQSSLLSDDDQPDAAGLAAAMARRAAAGHFDEWRGLSAGAATLQPVAAAAAHWQRFFSTLGPQGLADLGHKAARVQQRVREDGVTYNVYAEGGEGNRPWPLELLPFIVQPAEWALIEQGVTQRARLMVAALADIYGPQTLLRDALLPASLIFAHPQYLRPACGLWSATATPLHIAAFDLARTPEGGFCVLAQRLQAPSGLGYLLENRLIIAPQFPDQFAALRVQRLAAAFRSLLDGLMRASPAGARSRIVLLTPGPFNETYFEQVFLARYLGITLVEGHDLTVRGKCLFLKTLHGLEQVHVLLRRVDDEFLDPLELRPDSQLGVPGLLQALRAGEVVMANMPGAGVMESPGLTAFWPAVAQRLLGEPLRLPASTSWWCGEATVWAAQREKLADFVVAPTFPNSGFGVTVAAQLSPAELAALTARIDAKPAAFTLQERVRPGETPVWVGGAVGSLQPRAAVLRVFALSDGAGGWRVLPGALTRVAGAGAGAAASHDPWLSMQHGSASVDTWVITQGAVDVSSMLPKPLTAADLIDSHRSVTSRAAESLFWLGRYTERAENATRLTRLMLELLPVGSPPVLGLLGELATFHGLVGHAVPSPLNAPRRFERALMQGLAADSGATSVSHALRSLRRCAHTLRERLSPEHWKLIVEVDAHFETHVAQVLAEDEGRAVDLTGLLCDTATYLAAITGAQTDRMIRDDGWRLLSVGRQVERLHMLAHALALGFEQRVHQSDDGFLLLLGLFDSGITYSARFQARREALPLLHLLVMDTDNPRSLAWVARTLRDRLKKLARHDAAWADDVTAGFAMPEDWPLAALARPDADGRHATLIDALRQCCVATRGLNDEIGRRLFTHVPSPDRTFWQ